MDTSLLPLEYRVPLLFDHRKALTTLQWGRLSDRIGRKPVIMMGQAGLVASLLSFGLFSSSTNPSFAGTFWFTFILSLSIFYTLLNLVFVSCHRQLFDNMNLGIVFARSLAGLMDGNVGVVKTVIGELTDDSNRAMAFRLWPITWIVGGTLGEQLMLVD